MNPSDATIAGRVRALRPCTADYGAGRPNYAVHVGEHYDDGCYERAISLMQYLQEGWEGENCQACGVGYTDVYWLPNAVWEQITPAPDLPGAGLLCPACALQRIIEKGLL